MESSIRTEPRPLSPSRVIAEALVDRQGPNQITARARRLGFSPSLTTAVVAACCQTAVDTPRALRRPSASRFARRGRS